jgi:hypothetical protein
VIHVDILKHTHTHTHTLDKDMILKNFNGEYLQKSESAKSGKNTSITAVCK